MTRRDPDGRPPDEIARYRSNKRILGGAVASVAGAYLLLVVGTRVAEEMAGGNAAAIAVAALGVALLVVGAVVAPWLLHRRHRQATAQALGVDVDLGRLWDNPDDVEALRERIVSVGLVRSGVSSHQREKDSGEGMTQSFVVTREGDTVDLEQAADPAAVVSHALWLARQLEIPLMDGRTSIPHTFMPEELSGLDDDLVRSEPEPEPEPESESEAETESESESEPEPESKEQVARARLAARARQRS